VAAELARPDSELRKLAELYKRAANITKGVAETTADLAALSVTEPAEVALRDELMRAVPAAEAAAAAGDYAGAIRTLVALRPAVDRFFTDVMVMVDDAAVKETRLALVARLRDAIAANIGDLSQMNAV
jgi:glycyl-tRNA synthetase beta chain